VDEDGPVPRPSNGTAGETPLRRLRDLRAEDALFLTLAGLVVAVVALVALLVA
jgi:hypothetical protein